jgi:hypothetical protein
MARLSRGYQQVIKQNSASDDGSLFGEYYNRLLCCLTLTDLISSLMSTDVQSYVEQSCRKQLSQVLATAKHLSVVVVVVVFLSGLFFLFLFHVFLVFFSRFSFSQVFLVAFVLAFFSLFLSSRFLVFFFFPRGFLGSLVSFSRTGAQKSKRTTFASVHFSAKTVRDDRSSPFPTGGVMEHRADDAFTVTRVPLALYRATHL